MKFDRMGRRIEYIEREGETTLKHQKFVYDGYLCIQRLNGSNNAVTDLFEWDPTERVATRPLYWQHRTSSDNYSLFYTHDGNKNVSEVVFYQRARGVAAHYEYAPFGEVTVQTRGNAWGLLDLSSQNPIRFSSEFSDDTLGFVYYNYRHYEPCVGCWLNRDPIEEEGGENLYVFCSNNAISHYDSKGESFEDISNFCAGVGDSLTFGLTRLFRRGLNRMVEGTWGDPADVESTAYFAGEVSEVSVEIAVTLGGATLRHAAKTTSRVTVERSARSAYRKAHVLVGKGGEVHHINPIKGHPFGNEARYPLPYEWAAKSDWNMTWYATRAEHHAAHARMQMLEKIDKYRESTILTRQAINAIINHLDISEDAKCWEAIDVQTTIFYMEYELCEPNQNNVIPESIIIQLR